jgi:hypothetical protein
MLLLCGDLASATCTELVPQFEGIQHLQDLIGQNQRDDMSHQMEQQALLDLL